LPKTLVTSAMMLALAGSLAHAASSNDETFANAALRELHNLAVASAQSERAAKDNDPLGCRDAYGRLQKAAHEALTNMHQISFAPIDALKHVSALLRISNSSPAGCPYLDVVTRTNILPMMAGQAIAGLRTDYAIGGADWYTVGASGTIEAKNPLRYAQSLSDQSYSWIDVRSKGKVFIGVSDWKAEMASHDVGDPAIEDSGNNLKTVEVGYRKNSSDENTYVYFYRSRGEAQAAAQAAKKQAEDDAKAEADAKASNVMWRQKLMSLPFMIANRDVGFKAVYAVCKPTGKNAKGDNTCSDEGSHDWSDNPTVPYRWFGDVEGCENATFKLNTEHPIKVAPDESFVVYCMPAPKVSGRAVKGYKMIFALIAPGADDNLYADLRESASQAVRLFKTFNTCYDAVDAAYSNTMKELGADEGGNLLSDKTKSISLTATCVRVY
jgi:hypothetical protein